MTRAPGVPGSLDDLSPDWLTAALRAHGSISRQCSVRAAELEPVGVGSGFIGELTRLHLSYAGNDAGAPATVIAKLPSRAQGSRAVGTLYGLYEREVRFYNEIGDNVGMRTPHCYYSGMDAERDRYFLLLEDLAATATIGDQVRGCSEEEALLALRELAGMHAAWWNSPKLDAIAWLPRGTALVRAAMQGLYPQASKTLMEVYGDRIARDVAAVMGNLHERMLAMIPIVESRPHTLIHADYRLDNLFFGDGGAPFRLAAIDWQGPNRSIAAYDVAYFLSGCMPPELRRSSEARLLRAYHATLEDRGVQDYSFDDLTEDYRRSLLLAVAIMTVSGATLEMTNERAEQLWNAMFERVYAAISDNAALELLPA